MNDLNQIEVEVLADGSIKITTGRFSAAVHTSADNVIKGIETALGGTIKRNKRVGHSHTHSHAHGEQTHTH